MPTELAPTRARAWRQLAVSYLVTNGLVFALSRPGPMRFGLHELIGALFLAGGLVSIRFDDDDTRRYGVTLGGIFPGRAGDDRALLRAIAQGVAPAAREFVVAVAVAAVVLPVYAYFWPRFNPVPPARHFVLDGARWREILTNLLAVALPEELYFRGFVQTKLADALGVAREVSGGAGGAARAVLARVRAMAVPIALASLLFAVTHITVEVTLARAVVFFPGLLFGVLRAWRGGIGAAVFLHAISNVFELWLEGR